MTVATGELALLGEREHGRHDDRAGVQQRALVRVVEIGSVDERTVGEGCKRRIRARAAAAPDGRDRGRGECLREADDNAALVRIGIPCTDGAADGIEYDIAGLGDDGRRQVGERKARGEVSEGFGRTGRSCSGFEWAGPPMVPHYGKLRYVNTPLIGR